MLSIIPLVVLLKMGKKHPETFRKKHIRYDTLSKRNPHNVDSTSILDE
jgi:hypothetical protein